jgi:hypothetical protein
MQYFFNEHKFDALKFDSVKYNCDCCLQLHEYFKNNYFNIKQLNLSEFNAKR